MWPFDGGRERHVLRVGRVALEHWAENGGSLTLRGSLPWAGSAQPGEAALTAGLATLVAGGGLSGPVTVVLESAWAPVMLIEVGERLLNARALEVLAQHHLRTLYADETSGNSWEVRLENRPGESQALVFALPGSAGSHWHSLAREHGLKLKGLVPAFDWGRRQMGRQVPRDGWWTWVEQDRQILACMRNGRIAGLHPALPCCQTGVDVWWQLRGEATRLGLELGVPDVAVGHWGARREVEAVVGGVSVRWCGIAAAADPLGKSSPVAMSEAQA